MNRQRLPLHARRGRVNPFRFPVAKPKRLGPEHNPWYWNPNHPAIRLGPSDFRKRIQEIDPAYEVTWNPIRERWQVFARSPKINHPICQGWKLVFVVEEDGEYVPLDERTLAKAWDRSVRKWGDFNVYWNRIENEIVRGQEKREEERADSTRYGAGEYFDYTKIKVSMAGPSSGSKFTKYHSGE